MDLLTRLQKTINGYWEYLCVPTAPMTFEGAQTARGGRMRFEVIVSPIGLSIEVFGQRQWASTAPHSAPLAPSKLAFPAEWQGRGTVYAEDGKLVLRYTFNDPLTEGSTEDCFTISENSALGGERAMIVETGTFRQFSGDGRAIKGEVRLRKMTHKEDIQWGQWDRLKAAAIVPLLSAQESSSSSTQLLAQTTQPSIVQKFTITGHNSGVGGDATAGGDIVIGGSKPPSQLVEARQAFLTAIQDLPHGLREDVQGQFDQLYDAANATADKSTVMVKAKALDDFLKAGKALSSGPVATAWAKIKPWIGLGK